MEEEKLNKFQKLLVKYHNSITGGLGCWGYIITVLVIISLIILGFSGDLKSPGYLNVILGAFGIGLMFLLVEYLLSKAVVVTSNFAIERDVDYNEKDLKGYSRFSRGVKKLIRLKNGHVLDVEEAHWKRKGEEYYPVRWPKESKYVANSFEILSSISYANDQVSFEVPLILRVMTSEGKDFDAQEVYEKLSESGHQSIRKFIEERFQSFVKKQCDLKESALLYQEKMGFVDNDFIAAIRNALKTVNFDWGLSNIKAVSIEYEIKYNPQKELHLGVFKQDR